MPTYLSQKLECQLLAFKIKKIYHNPIIACYRRQFRALQEFRLFLEAQMQNQSLSEGQAAPADEDWELARQSAAE